MKQLYMGVSITDNLFWLWAHSFGQVPPEKYDCSHAAENTLKGQGTKDDPFVLMSSKPFEANRST